MEELSVLYIVSIYLQIYITAGLQAEDYVTSNLGMCPVNRNESESNGFCSTTYDIDEMGGWYVCMYVDVYVHTCTKSRYYVHIIYRFIPHNLSGLTGPCNIKKVNWTLTNNEFLAK